METNTVKMKSDGSLDNLKCRKLVPRRSPDFTPQSYLQNSFLASVEDCSKDEEIAKTEQEEYQVDYGSCVGALLYLLYTRQEINCAVVKFAKYTRCPGVVQMEALLYLLRYLRGNGLRIEVLF
jgi:hypothetical protein